MQTPPETGAHTKARPPGQIVALAYAIWALPIVLLLAWIVPPWTNTDETFHMLRAVNIAHGHLLGARFESPDPTGLPGSGGPSDDAIFKAFKPLATLSWLPGQPNGQVTGARLAASEAVKWQHQLVPVWFGTTAQYPPFFYLPDIAGYWMGVATKSRVNATLRMSRSLNAIVFVSLAALAIARSRRLRPLLTVVLMLPMTLALAASANQDAGMIAVMALAVAQIDRITDQQRSAQPLELACIATALACVAMGRPPYAALFVILLPLAPGRPGRIAAAGAAGAAGLWCALVAIYVMRPLNHEAVPAAQLASLLAAPSSVITIAVNTIRLSLGEYIWTFIGKLAWNDAPLPLPYLILASCTLAAAALAAMDGPARGRRWVIAAAICVIIGVHALLYVDWTAPGTDHVNGVTGRHFLPLALAAGLALPSWARASRLKPAAIAAALLMGIATPPVIVLHVIKHFYITPG